MPNSPQPDSSNPLDTRVAVMGAGAVGSYFGGMLARAGARVTLIGRPAHVEAVRREKLFMDTVTFQEHVAVEASADPEAVAGAGVVLLSVKGSENEEASRSIAPHLAPGAIVVSLQNGVDNIERIRQASGIDALPSVVYIAVALPEPGHVKHTGNGALAVGELEHSAHRGQASRSSSSSLRSALPSARAEKIAALFAAAGVPCKVSDYIEADLWSKFMVNCAGNAISAIAQCTYRQAAGNPASRELMSHAIAEAAAVARAAGIRLPDANHMELGIQALENIGGAMSSTSRDLARGKRTEIESLNGYVVRRGRELGVDTPANLALYAMVKLLEDSGARSRQARPAGSSH
jgi:2-dehydropantoate 2-reductase